MGSELFEAICLLPEYGLTRADTRLLQQYAGEICGEDAADRRTWRNSEAEAEKRLDLFWKRWHNHQRTFYYPIEISPAALAACEKELGQLDFVSLVGYEKPYLEGLRAVAIA